MRKRMPGPPYLSARPLVAGAIYKRRTLVGLVIGLVASPATAAEQKCEQAARQSAANGTDPQCLINHVHSLAPGVRQARPFWAEHH